MKRLASRVNTLSRKSAPPLQAIFVVHGSDPATWPKPDPGADVAYLTVYTGMERPGDDPAACEAALAEYRARHAIVPRIHTHPVRGSWSGLA